MNDYRWTNGFSAWSMLLFIGVFHLNSIFCLSLNHEGVALLKFKERVVNDPFRALSSWNEKNGEDNPCSWFGVGCVSGHVNSMNLENLCLEGTLTPELHHLLHIKSILLRNNSFSGFIPEEIRNLKELELLDLSYNNICRSTPHDCDIQSCEFWNLSHRYCRDFVNPLLTMSFLCRICSLLDNNGQSCYIPPGLEDLMLSKLNVGHDGHTKDVGRRRILQDQPLSSSQESNGKPSSPDKTGTRNGFAATPSLNSDGAQPAPNPPSPHTNVESPSSPNSIPPPSSSQPPPPRVLSPSPPHPRRDSPRRNRLIPIVVGAVGGVFGLVLIGILLFLLRGIRIRKATGFSGQLKRAFVLGNDRSDGLNSDKPSFIEGIPNFKRSELQTACEDFSNVIGSSSIGTIYKGTLSNGVEIAAISLAVTSAKDWSKNLEVQFKKKIELLSKVNHKNFVNLIGYCEEEEPFTRLMVFEYAPNGSLFEHLHVREAEHLDWGMRLRVAMGMAYCLEHMHNLTPPVTHPNLNSSAVNLSEDYAAKISDFCFWNEVAAPRVQPYASGVSNLTALSVSPESNVYSFGLLFLEMMTGRIPQMGNNSLDVWVMEYMRGEKPLQEIVDPMLRRFNSEQLDKISELIRKCLHSEQHRPTMRDVTARLREITGIIQDKAVPRFSSLWWTELDTPSVNGT